MRRLLPTLMFAILLTILLLGCGESAPDTEDVIGKAMDAIEKVQTYRIEGEATVTQGEETTQSGFQMEFVSPDRIRTTTMEENASSESIRIGQTEYNKHLDNDKWQVRQWPESFPSYNMAVMMVKSFDGLVGLVRLANEKIDGVDCFHYKGSEDMEGRVDERKAELDPSQLGYEEQLRLLEAQRQSQSELEFWIGKEDYLLRCLEQHNDIVFIEDMGKDTEREAHTTMVVKYTFYDFNQPIQIEPPVAESVKGVNLVASMGSTGNGGDDLEHYHFRIFGQWQPSEVFNI